MSLQQIRRENEVAVKLRKNLEHEMVVLEERKAVSSEIFFYIHIHTCDLSRYGASLYVLPTRQQKSRYLSILIFCFCQKLKLVFPSPQMLALSKFTTGSDNRSLLFFRNR